MLDTDQLRSFVAIIDTGSFTRAAERVNKTQSAVSMQIRRLEEVLGRPLFVKQGRGVRLSDDGEKLVDYARQMLQLEAAAFASVSHKALAGRVRLGIPDDYADTFLPEIVTRFMRRHPLVEISVVCESSLTLGERVSMRDIDMAIITDCGSLKGAEPLREEPLRWVTGAASCAHEARPLPLALSGPTCAWRRAAVEALETAGIGWRLLLASSSQAALAPVVRAGLAVTVFPECTISPGLRLLDESAGLPSLPKNRIGLLVGQGNSAEATALAEEIRGALREGPRPIRVERASDLAFSGEPVSGQRARSRAAA